MKAPKFTHDELVARAARWLKSYGCRYVITERAAYTFSGEIPDAIGWRAGDSFLIECKTSRSDFLADKKKTFRQYPDQGMGDYRLFLCEKGLISVDELPEGWGLLEISESGKRIEKTKFLIEKDRWSNHVMKHNDSMRFSVSLRSEIALLVSELWSVNMITRYLDEQVDVADGLIRKLEAALLSQEPQGKGE